MSSGDLRFTLPAVRLSVIRLFFLLYLLNLLVGLPSPEYFPLTFVSAYTSQTRSLDLLSTALQYGLATGPRARRAHERSSANSQNAYTPLRRQTRTT